MQVGAADAEKVFLCNQKLNQRDIKNATEKWHFYLIKISASLIKVERMSFLRLQQQKEPAYVSFVPN